LVCSVTASSVLRGSRLGSRPRKPTAPESWPSRAISFKQFCVVFVVRFRGIAMPPMRLIAKRAFAVHRLEGFGCWRDTALTLWRDGSFREERYAAIELTGDRACRAHQGAGRPADVGLPRPRVGRPPLGSGLCDGARVTTQWPQPSGGVEEPPGLFRFWRASRSNPTLMAMGPDGLSRPETFSRQIVW
jgi:hypothetical protein